MSSTASIERLHSAIQSKIDIVAKAVKIPGWRFKITEPQTETVFMLPDFDDSEWEIVSLMKTWSSADGEAWFRTQIQIPADVEGISLNGSRLDLEVFLAIGASVYVNGKEMFREAFWTDSRAVILTLTESYIPGQPLHLAVRCNAGDGFGLFLLANLRFAVLDDAIFEMDLARSQLNFTHFLLTGGSSTPGGLEPTRPTAGGPVDDSPAIDKKSIDPLLVEAWHDASGSLDLEALNHSQWPRWQDSVTAMREALAPFAAMAKTYRGHLIAHSHVDMNWLWPWRETVEVCRRDFSAVDRLMAVYPEFHFSQSMASTYAAIEEAQPELFERIWARVQEGRWDVTANTWVEGDLNMAGSEALVRQIIHTRRYVTQRFGVEPLICWEPDTFGHTANYPQILAKCGIKFYYFCRAGKRQPLFWWQGIDGSRVLAVQDPRGYGGENNPSNVVGSVIDFAGRYNIHRGLYVYGAGDHGGGATARDIENARKIDQAPYIPRALPSTSVAFYEGALAEAQDLPVVAGELNTVFEGCYTSHADIKRMNRDGENSLLSAETAASLASLMTGQAYPLDKLTEAWRILCFHQFHDILCGCAIGVTYREARERFTRLQALARETTSSAMGALASSVDTGVGEGYRVVVFNPLANTRTDVVRVPLSSIPGIVPNLLQDDLGTLIPTQVSNDQLVFIANDVPSLGMRVYHAVTDSTAHLSPADAGDNELNNGILKLHVNADSGAIDSLVDLASGRELAGPWTGWGPEAKLTSGYLNRMQVVWEQPHPMSAWNIGDTTRVDHLITGASVKVLVRGPVYDVIEVKRDILHSQLTQHIVLYRGMRRIDFETKVDWHEKGSAHADAPMLRVAFTPFLEAAKATFEVAYAGIERPSDGREVPALRWVDVSDKQYGVSLLNNAKYGHQVNGNTLGLTLLRASYEPDNNPDEGNHEFTYSLYPHNGTWMDASTEQQAAGLNQPLLAAVTDGHTGNVKPGVSGVHCSAKNTVVSAVKHAEEQPEQGRTLIVRMYESHGKATDAIVEFTWPVEKAEVVDLLERTQSMLPLDMNRCRVAFTPHEIVTLKLTTFA